MTDQLSDVHLTDEQEAQAADIEHKLRFGWARKKAARLIVHLQDRLAKPAHEREPPHCLPKPSLDVLKRVAARMRETAPDTAYLAEWAVEQIEEHQQSFDLRWKADMRAIKRWQEAHPGSDLTWPDHADLCVWLLEQLDARAAQPPGGEQ